MAYGKRKRALYMIFPMTLDTLIVVRAFSRLFILLEKAVFLLIRCISSCCRIANPERDMQVKTNGHHVKSCLARVLTSV